MSNNFNGRLIPKQTLKGKIYIGIIREGKGPDIDLIDLEVDANDNKQIFEPSNKAYKKVTVNPIDITKSQEYNDCLNITNDIYNGDTSEYDDLLNITKNILGGNNNE